MQTQTRLYWLLLPLLLALALLCLPQAPAAAASGAVIDPFFRAASDAAPVTAILTVISSSWDTDGEFEPAAPVNVASKAAYDAGMAASPATRCAIPAPTAPAWPRSISLAW
ncbi:MAG TPA: hypothetical protein VNL77_14630 [Roseiflexaceae bacterium]|nr:hypothetical protein [Roseiflexaceae bacterium]